MRGVALHLEIRAALLELGSGTLRGLGGAGERQSAAFDVAARSIATHLERVAGRGLAGGADEEGEAPLAPTESAREHRVSRRVEMQLAAEIRKSGGTFATAFVLDLSTHGFRLESHLWLQDGATLWLRIPGLAARRARVAWVRGPVTGCAFEEPLHEAVLDLIVVKADRR